MGSQLPKQEKRCDSLSNIYTAKFKIVESIGWTVSENLAPTPTTAVYSSGLLFKLSRQRWNITLMLSGVPPQPWHQWYHRGPYSTSCCVWNMLLMDQNSSHEGKSHQSGRSIHMCHTDLITNLPKKGHKQVSKLSKWPGSPLRVTCAQFCKGVTKAAWPQWGYIIFDENIECWLHSRQWRWMEDPTLCWEVFCCVDVPGCLCFCPEHPLQTHWGSWGWDISASLPWLPFPKDGCEKKKESNSENAVSTLQWQFNPCASPHLCNFNLKTTNNYFFF